MKTVTRMKMKHIFNIYAALFVGAAMMLGSCENRMSEEGNIGFTANVASFKGVGASTKAALIGDPADEASTYVPLFNTTYGTSGFTVSAYKGTAAKFTNATSTYSGGVWTLNKTAKWYSGETLDFYAMAATAGVSNFAVNASTKKITFDYTLPGINGVDQPDVMVGTYSGTGVEGTQDGTRVAPLTFYHPLTAVRLKVGDIAGCDIVSTSITGVYHKGSCTVDVANLGTDAAFTWTKDTEYAPATGNAVGIEFNPAHTAVADEYLGGTDSTFMFIPTTFTAADSLFVVIKNPGTTDRFTLFSTTLDGIQFKAGKVYDITVNFEGISLETFDEAPVSMIVPWLTQSAVVYNDFSLMPTLAYLTSGEDFNTKIKSLGTIREIVFDRNGSVDESGLRIEDPAHPEGFPIYASYDNATGTVRITTHANLIHAHQSLKGMFKSMKDLTKITWGLFFDTEETTDMSEMFKNCESLLDINLIDVANTKNVTTVAHMFDSCLVATRILLGNEFNTRNVTDVSYMFNECRSLHKIDLGQYFDTRNVTDMSYMFCNCVEFHRHGDGQLDVGELFYTWRVEHFDYMFYNCQAHYLHFNSRFSIKSEYPYLATEYGIPTTVPTATNMMYHALASPGTGRRAIFITSNTWNWINNYSRTGITPSHDGWGTTGLPQIVVPREE